MSVLLRKKYESIKKDKLSEGGKKLLQTMATATNNFKDAKASAKIKTKFLEFFNKLKTSKPEAIKGLSAPKEPSKSKQFKEARERRSGQSGVSQKESDIQKDAGRPAISVKGRRVTDGKHYPYVKGNVYYEYRDNRYDKRPKKYPKLEDGGMMEDGGEVRKTEAMADEVVEKYIDDLKNGVKVKRYFYVRGKSNPKYFETIIPNKSEEGMYKRYESTSQSSIGTLQNEYLDEDDVRKYLKKTVIQIWKDKDLMADGGYMAMGGEPHRIDEIFAEGGTIAQGNNEMLQSQLKAVEHHAKELSSILNKDTEVEAWVVGKIERAATDLSDITHYLDGRKFEDGGKLIGNQTKLDVNKNGKLDAEDFKLLRQKAKSRLKK